jgi:hypothetical protein
LIKIGSGIQKLIGGIHGHREFGDRICLLLFFQNKESSLKIRGKQDFLKELNDPTILEYLHLYIQCSTDYKSISVLFSEYNVKVKVKFSPLQALEALTVVRG